MISGNSKSVNSRYMQFGSSSDENSKINILVGKAVLQIKLAKFQKLVAIRPLIFLFLSTELNVKS